MAVVESEGMAGLEELRKVAEEDTLAEGMVVEGRVALEDRRKGIQVAELDRAKQGCMDLAEK